MNTTESWTPAFATYTSYSLRLGHAAVDRAAVDRAVDLARTLLSGAQGQGPGLGTQLAPGDPRARP